ncbi:WbqC family protein [Streptomyces sp. NPDC059096]|uniref:WbqC family protein n=1 Tax=Streptomyces sp. NPDC059096 TaxID=3346727 RepID=UPI0036A0359B
MQRTNLSFAPASPAASSPREQPAPGGLCAIHQPNLFPRLTTLAKLFAADYWIVLDDVQFTRRDYQHRARLAAIDAPDRQQWLSIPTHLPSGRSTLIRDALIDDADLARRRIAGILRQNFGASPHWPSLAQALEPVLDAFATGRTAVIAETSTRVLLDLLGWRGRILRSSLLSARPGRSLRLADLAAATGARAYLCGTGGMTYLDPVPFAARNITVAAFRPPTTGIWSTARRLSALWALASLGSDTLTSRLRAVADDHAALRATAPELRSSEPSV